MDSKRGVGAIPIVLGILALTNVLSRMTGVNGGDAENHAARPAEPVSSPRMPLIVVGLSAAFLGAAAWVIHRSIPAAVRRSPPPPPSAPPLLTPVDVDALPLPADASCVKVDPRWSLESVLENYRPHEIWRGWFAEAYAKAIESSCLDEQSAGWRAAAIMFGDSHVPLFCLFASLHGRSLLPQNALKFDGNIDLCLLELGLARAAGSGGTSIAIRDLGERDTFHRDEAAAVLWLGEQLRPFGGSLKRGAVFAMQWTAVQFGLPRGPSDPSIDEVLDEPSWKRTRSDPVN